MTQWIATSFLTQLIKAVPYQVHIVLSDNNIQFTNRAQDGYTRNHCVTHGIAHRLRQDGQVERMSGLLKTATVKR